MNYNRIHLFFEKKNIEMYVKVRAGLTLDLYFQYIFSNMYIQSFNAQKSNSKIDYMKYVIIISFILNRYQQIVAETANASHFFID